jgi:geranylgeranyl diphosphate synthase type I
MKQILDYSAVIRPELEAFIKSKISGGGQLTPWKADFLNRLLPYATAGKLLRASLVCFSYEAFSGQRVNNPVIKAAMALELTHSALLIHDDIMDNDDLRRGQPSLHRQYQSLATGEKLADADHFGTSMAICGGDAALFLAFELLASCQAAPQVQATVQQLFVNQLVTTCAGQMQDLYLEARPDMPSKKAIHELMQTKTASYSLSLPMAIGAALAGQTAATLTKLQNIGISAGTIFQIRDDELGIMGKADEIGKPVGSDITEGKKTLVYYYLLRNCSASEYEKAKAIFGNPIATPEDIEYIQKLVKRHKIPQLLNNEVSRLEKAAIKHINGLSVSIKNKAEFKELVRFCGNRSL